MQDALKWNENAFNADRDGFVPFGPNEASFTDADHNIHPLGAPTRGSTPVPSLKHPTTSDEEDAEMQRAIEMSRESANYDHQETGIVNSSSNAVTRFGPATRSNYEMNQWAVTLPGQEIMPDLEPLDRVNQHGEPRCLRPLPSHQYLPNLLTILQFVPLARNALLMPTKTSRSYGQDAEWWKGQTIRLPRIVSTVDLSSAEPATSEGEELITEMQRLMALLGSSKRSYGSVDSLLRLDAVNNITSELPAETLIDRVLHAWELSVKQTDPDSASDAEIFRSVMGTTDEDGVATPFMRLMPLRLGDNHGGQRPVTLTEALNELLWDPDDPEEYDNYIEHPAEVLCIHVSHENQGREQAGLIIPPVFHLDQYLKENVGETRGLRKEIAQTKHRITTIESTRLKLESLQRGEAKGHIDASLLFDHSIGHFSGQNKQSVLDERMASGADVDVDLPSPLEHHEHIVERLNAVYASIKARLDREFTATATIY